MEGSTPSDDPTVTHTTITSSDGVVVTVHDFAGPDPSGPTVLAAHATGFHGMVWQPLAGTLAHSTGARVVAPDLRGHGASALPEGVVLDWDGFADDVLAVIDALGLHKPVGVGHSKGGAALLRAEARRPGTFAGLWCFEPVVFPPEVGRERNEGNPLAAGAMRRRDLFDSALEARANYGSKPPMAAFDPRVLDAYVAHGLEPVDPLDPDGPVRLRCRPEIEAETYRMGAAHNTFEFLGDVACPAVIACGGPEPFGPGNFADQIAGAITHGRLARYDDLGHFGPLTHPDTMATDIAAFIDEVTGGANGGPSN
jgi:pimeloyl-ACP methyl ester carboxylesterase